MKIYCLMHVPFEDAANIGVWAELRGHTLRYTHLFHTKALPSVKSFDMLVIMGGPMNVYEHDRYPWLVREKELVRQAIDANKKVLGVCLGAQLIADVLGGHVRPNGHKEIGWHTVQLTPQAARHKLFKSLPGQMMVFHWHGDTFSLPPQAIHLASSAACANQAFAWGGQVLALQFHLEYSGVSIERMLTHCGDELVPAPYIQTAEQIRAGYENIPQTTEWLFALLDAFTAPSR